ncbi:MAG: flagellar biosynthesis protein FlhF [Bacteroidales bacterium]|nr:flagellar biosynthesis protein FlhF [Bacteroidales bacterium]MCM1415610.1 flagellar biosynthesis protein FlhF [bacterium]MCM1423003.1 flagellar biosynthesis protein FlhF [bacterium]
MIIKKFIAKTEKEAIENARKELGEGVVVMNVKPVKSKGLFAFLKTPMVEVTVALEEESEKYTAAVSAINSVIASSQNTPVMETPKERDRDKDRDRDRDTSSAIEEKLDSLQTLLEQQLQKPEGEKEEKEEAAPPKEESETDKFMRLLHDTMLENEVDEKYAQEIIDEIELVNKPNIPFDYALANIYQKMILKFGKPSGIEPAANGIKLVFFIGPTGVGKTTTIAKIASKFRVDEKKKVALLTADTYRIAAAEQLRTYANILEVPFRVIYTVEEISKALEDFKDYDYIMMDTAGHSHQNSTQKDNMCNIIHSVDDKVEKEVHLVLSATTKYRDLISIADSYKELADYKLIFTKLDETTTLGNLLNLRLYTGASLSYVTYGQNVPDDIEDFNPQKTVKRLLGGKN